MTLKHLKIFTEVCRFESITAAAKSMGMTQPAVSASIKELERYYNIRLFDRMNNRLYITEAGKRMLIHINEINRQLSELNDIADRTRGDRNLRIGVDTILGVYPLPELLDRFHMDEPNIKVEVSVATPKQLEEKLFNNELDVVLSSGFDSSMFNVGELGKAPLCFLCGSKYYSFIPNRVSLEELNKQPLLRLATDSPVYESYCRNVMERAGINYSYMTSVSLEPLINATIAGLGIIVLPKFLAERLVLKSGNLRTVETEDISAELSFYSATHKQKTNDPSVEHIIELAKAMLSRS